jgi:2-dehydro-3-deoxyphosphogluconate aldolase/(4S)-4-hydroxy-2-oxoglutarate aldolase
MMIEKKIEKGRIIPVIALEDAKDAAPLCRALKAGGLEVAEITFRTKAAREAIRIVAEEFPEFILGAGTVTTIQEVKDAKQAGAQFAVAPGFNPRIVEMAQELHLPFFPGVCTPGEVEAALEKDCRILKFFPAGIMGGPAMVKALYGCYAHRGVRFIPTGGVTAQNVNEYLSHESVIAVGGTWIVEKAILKAKDWDMVTKLTSEALSKLV